VFWPGMLSQLPVRPHSTDAHSIDSVHDLGLLRLLEHDLRPTFILDSQGASTTPTLLKNHFVYNNHVFSSIGLSRDLVVSNGTVDSIIDNDNATSLLQFRDWSKDSSTTKHIEFNGYNWTKYTIAGHWSVINGISSKPGTQIGGSNTDKPSSPNLASQTGHESFRNSEELIYKGKLGHPNLQRFAERSDIGIFILGSNGVYSYRNEAWYAILKPDHRDIELDEA